MTGARLRSQHGNAFGVCPRSGPYRRSTDLTRGGDDLVGIGQAVLFRNAGKGIGTSG
ncbi:hypothetical protein PhaeoP14_02124 [Phaeobacter piscinae]|nr:hypothetical protein PhaeoP14_02124 [Phaeobacter piscinae]